ncbi:DUF5403 family protein [Pseudoclavibacter sp. 13-3]|uniref:DUF5403 family protein n=1 Tax=Pseudoclavibacter sp. 13-3 TaxID=2901228 RepID=UPI001E2BC5CE|nr:DUF5403 family protein [Pseudoclavibacter sp. 13-3]MCD7100452.1 DUF5403 family protein [Pseudoclavibacter sp. 13-3]
MVVINKSAALQAARAAAVQKALQAKADQIAGAARTRAAGHGSLASRIGVAKAPGKKGVIDRLVTLDHVEAGNIEFGHFHNRNPETWVAGLHVMRNAAQDVTG